MKTIKLNENAKEKIMQVFRDYLDTAKLTDNIIEFKANLTEPQKDIKRPQVYIKSNAYLKMLLYVRETSTEIAWHGTVTRDKATQTYLIHDVFLYPQKITGATVDTDQDKYNEWLISLDDDTANTLRFQGHSHVNFGVTPSGTDLQYYEDMLNVLPSDDYYIFMILNKSNLMTLLIYDLGSNTIYETRDIDVKILLDNTNTDLLDSIQTDKDKYCEPPYKAQTSVTTYDDWRKAHYPTFTPGFKKDTAYDDFVDDRDVPPECKTETDKLFEDIDNVAYRFKNPKLHAKTKKNKVRSKYESK